MSKPDNFNTTQKIAIIVVMIIYSFISSYFALTIATVNAVWQCREQGYVTSANPVLKSPMPCTKS